MGEAYKEGVAAQHGGEPDHPLQLVWNIRYGIVPAGILLQVNATHAVSETRPSHLDHPVGFPSRSQAGGKILGSYNNDYIPSPPRAGF